MTSTEPSNVSTIKEMPAPQTKGEFQSFLGMVTYLAPFIPRLSSHTAMLRGLLVNDVEYSWNATYQVIFYKLKPVAFTSKVLTTTEQHCANNEMKLLTYVLAAEHFWTMFLEDTSQLRVITNHWNRSP